MPERSRRVRLVGPLLLAVVVVVTLVVGSVHSASASNAQRIVSLESQIKCPACTDLSVLDSTDPTADSVRALITRDVDEGQSDSRIKSYLVGRYGQTILLLPPDSGLSSALYILPITGAVIAAGVVGALFWRRSQAMTQLRNKAEATS